jgi:hypothetical protein
MNNINETFNISSLSRDEIRTLLESLLFASSCDVGASFYKEESLAMFELAKKIRSMFPDIILENLDVTPIVEDGNEVYHDKHSSEIVEYFPEILNKEIKK